jgi:hypothetical protein
MQRNGKNTKLKIENLRKIYGRTTPPPPRQLSIIPYSQQLPALCVLLAVVGKQKVKTKF